MQNRRPSIRIEVFTPEAHGLDATIAKRKNSSSTRTPSAKSSLKSSISTPHFLDVKSFSVKIEASAEDEEDEDEVFEAKVSAREKSKFFFTPKDFGKTQPLAIPNSGKGLKRPRYPSFSSPNNSTDCSTAKKWLCVNSPNTRASLPHRSVDSLSDLQLLGKGGFGSVVLGSWRGQKVAVKFIKNDCDLIGKKNRRESIASELNAVGIKNEHVVQILEVVNKDDSKVVSDISQRIRTENEDYESSSAIHSIVIMEYVGKANLQFIIEQRPDLLTKRFIQRCLYGLSSALEEIHFHRIAHLDVKPDNVFVSSEGRCKLGDFGCSKKILRESREEKFNENLTVSLDNLVGTVGYQAPEMIRSQRCGFKCDIYSFGILSWQMWTGEVRPFPDTHPHIVMYQVTTSEKRPDLAKVSDSKKAKLCSICWTSNPLKRPSASQLKRQIQALNFEENSLTLTVEKNSSNLSQRRNSLRI